jgi:dynein heavy chain 1, cytosolic
VRSNLTDLKAMCDGVAMASNLIRQLAKDIYNDIIPTAWMRFNFLKKLTISQWILDFKRRLDQFEELIKNKSDYQKKGVWLGGLLFPEAFLTASRQFVAQ